MNHVTGIQDYRQMQMSSLEDSIGQDNPIRFIDAFVEQLDLLKLGFEVKTLKNEVDQVLNLLHFLKFICMAI